MTTTYEWSNRQNPKKCISHVVKPLDVFEIKEKRKRSYGISTTVMIAVSAAQQLIINLDLTLAYHHVK